MCVCVYIYLYIYIYIYIYIERERERERERTFLPKEAKDTRFSNAHGIFSKIDHEIGHKTSLHKFKKVEIILNIFSDHEGLELETDPKEKTQEHSNSWRWNSMLLKNEWVKKDIKDKI